MAIRESQRSTESTAGKGSSVQQTVGASTNTRSDSGATNSSTEIRPEVSVVTTEAAVDITRTTSNPEVTRTTSTGQHAGVLVSFRVKFRNKQPLPIAD